jgi:release factor glutamine methyltransferase
MTQDEIWLLKEKYSGEKTEGFFADCLRLAIGEPLAYLIGSIPFLNTTIFLDSHPLIPRPETEYWVEKIIADIAHRNLSSVRVLDLCAGSGCVGVAVLRALPIVRVDFAEIDTHHHSIIQKNILKNDIDSSRTHILGGDLFEQVTERYDYILTNPPYIDPILDRAEESVKEFEPHLALYGGENGLEIIYQILEHAFQFLTDEGVLVIEHEPEQVALLQMYADTCGLIARVETDQFGVHRYTRFTRKEVILVSK